MAWETEGVLMLRHLINDVDAPYDYSDARLETTIAIAARYVNTDIDFSTNYVIDVSTPDITPDPTDTASDGEEFLNFAVLKAACMLDISTLRIKALAAGIEAKCGPAVLKTVEHLAGFKELLTQGPCAAYDELKKQFKFGNLGICRAILSPFVNNNFDPLSLPQTQGTNRDGYYR